MIPEFLIPIVQFIYDTLSELSMSVGIDIISDIFTSIADWISQYIPQ